jgi:hypothetical protein
MAFVGEKLYLNSWHVRGINTFEFSSKTLRKRDSRTIGYDLDFLYACVIMHETGHTLGIDWLFPPGCDAKCTAKPWCIGYWIFRNYKSCMNYRYTYKILDYSDGTHGIIDFNDWGNIDFTFFEKK